MPQDPGSQKNQNPKLIESIAFSFLSINRIGSKQGILFFTSGCVSTLMRVVRDPLQSSSNSYPSVRMAGDSLKHPDILTPLILLDLPFSAALDTVMLPSDAANAKRLKKHNPKTEKE